MPRTLSWKLVAGSVGIARARKYMPPRFREAVRPPTEPLA